MQQELKKHGVEAYINQSGNGDNVAREVLQTLRGCRLPVILGTKTYGTPTASPCSTEIELRSILSMQNQEGKQYFLVKMCEGFDDPIAFSHFTEAIGYVKWTCGTPMPSKVVSEILAHRQLQLTSNPVSFSAGSISHSVSKADPSHFF